MTRGRKPDPTSVKERRGTKRSDRAVENEPRPRGTPRCPPWLSAEGRKEWKRLEPELVRMQLLTSVDQATFAAYCEAWADFRYFTMQLRKTGRIIKTPSGYKQAHPFVSMRRQAKEMIVKLASEFGFSPSARTRIDAPLPPLQPEAKDEPATKKEERKIRLLSSRHKAS